MDKVIETIKIKIFKERDFKGFSASIIFDGKMQYATQGENYPELYKNIYDIMKIKLENEERQSEIEEVQGR